MVSNRWYSEGALKPVLPEARSRTGSSGTA
jgi:hypothetical protein